MKDPADKPATIDEYLSGCPDDIRDILEKIRQVIRSAAPEATETISYGIPTFKLRGRNLVHFGGFKDHASFFPTSSPIPVFEKELAPYSTSSGTIRFSIGQDIPYDLIRRITEYRVTQLTAK